MTSLTRLRTQALCFTFLGLAACSGDDNAAPAAGGSAGSGGSGGSSVAEAAAGDSTHPDVAVTPDSASDAVSDAGDGGLLNCPSLPDGGAMMTMDGGEGGGADAGFAFPQTLVETGLYCDFATKTVAPNAKQFRPKYELWSDGAVKTRWVSLPPGSKVDTTDMDHWSMPVGARFWKEFKYNGKRVETRVIVRVAAGTAVDFRYAAYKWDAGGETTATLWNSATGEKDYAPIGPGAEGVLHDIPSEAECGRCHGPAPEHILGFSAIQLSHNLGGETLTTLAAASALSVAPPAAGFTVPGNTVEEPALGFLHANCGNCHNETPTGVTVALPYIVKVLVSNTTVASTFTYKTAVNVAHSIGLPLPTDGGLGIYRVQGGNPDASELHYRMSTRTGVNQQMPPIDTKITTPDGLTIIETWIKALPSPSDAGDGG